MLSEPSDLIKLKRRAGAKAGRIEKRDRADPDVGEQIVSHGGHLALSAVAGAAYGVAKPDSVSPIIAGTAFGVGFYALAYGVLGPMMRITPRLSKDTPASITQHALFHLLFGITTALVADRMAKRL